MNKLIKLLVVMVAVALFLPSCAEDEKTYDYKLTPANVQVSTATLNFGVNDLAPQTLPVTATEGGRYWISDKPTWVTATLKIGGQAYATGSSTLSISVSPNETLLERDGKISISFEAAGGIVESVAIPVKQGIAPIGPAPEWQLDNNSYELEYTTGTDSVLLTAPVKTKFVAKFLINKKDDNNVVSTVADDRFEVVKGEADTTQFYVVFKPTAENLGNDTLKTSLVIQKNNDKEADDKTVLAVVTVKQVPLKLGGITGWTIPESINWDAAPDSIEKAITIVAPTNQNVTFKLVDADKKFEITTDLTDYIHTGGSDVIKAGELAVTTSGTALNLRNLVEDSEAEIVSYLLIYDKDGKAVGKVKLILAKK